MGTGSGDTPSDCYLAAARDGLARALRELRVERGLTKAELARRSGTRPGTIASYEAGRTQPRLEQMARLCRSLGVSMTELARRMGID